MDNFTDPNGDSQFERYIRGERDKAKVDEEKAKKQLVADVQRYRSDRVAMMTDLKKRRETLKEVIYNGITNPEEAKIARLACCILAADLCVEDAAMMDKTGEMRELLRSPDVIDDMLGL